MAGMTRPLGRSALAALGAFLVLGTAAAPVEALPNTSSPTLRLNRTIHTNPFTGTSTKMKDGEGSAYVAADTSLWLAEDNSDQAYEVNPTTGALKRVITQSEFAAAPKLGGGASAGSNRIQDLESMAYDTATDTLYAFSGKCCTSSVLPTAFRLKRGSDHKFHVESYQPLPSGSDFTASAVHPGDGKLYVGVGSTVRQYTYDSNTVGSTFSVTGVSGIYGMSFSDNGADLLVAASQTKLIRADWATKKAVAGWAFNLSSFGMGDTRAVELINDQFYVLDGFDSRASSDPLKYAVYVFDVVGPGTPPTASFTGSPTSGGAPLTVGFADTSTGNPTSWSWNFGDGGTSTQQNPSHTYTTPNTYSVSLTASNAAGSNTFTRSNYIVATGVDDTPPDTFIDSGPSGTTGSTSATFTFSASEPGTFACDLDGGGLLPCSSPQTYSGLSATTHTFQVRATDNATNPDPTPASRTWTIVAGAAQIARQATSTTVNATATNAITIPTPAGTSAGDVLVACVALNGGTVNGVPSGWAPIAAVTSVSNPHVYGYYKVAGVSEPTPTWNLSASVANGGGIARYSGVSNLSPLDSAPSTGASATAVTAASVPGVTTVSPDAMVAGCVGINSSSAAVTIASPADLTEAWDIAGKRNEVADGLQGAAGPSGTKTWTLSSVREFAGWLVALHPA
ncbi:MAG: PKD domain-containing protein [Actinobacteria bacterium]|nr:MAG: PKD domain-containing protein [Actinomycetota bacterium]